jgi:hypothetical protein
LIDADGMSFTAADASRFTDRRAHPALLPSASRLTSIVLF